MNRLELIKAFVELCSTPASYEKVNYEEVDIEKLLDEVEKNYREHQE